MRLPMPTKTRRNTVTLPTEMWDDLHRLTALEPGASLSKVIEDLLREAMTKHEEKLVAMRKMSGLSTKRK